MSAADIKEYRRRAEDLEADWNMERDRRQTAEAQVESLLAALDAATERAEKAEGALARVEEVAQEWDGAGAYTSMIGHAEEAVRFHGQALRLREAMEGKP